VFGQVKDIISQEGFSSCQDNNGLSHQTDLIQDLKAFLRIQFSGIGAAIRCRPAMNTIQIAASRHFPGHKSQLVFMGMPVLF
jgi:hypothetical protein